MIIIALNIASIMVLIYFFHKGVVSARKRNYFSRGLVYKQKNYLSVKRFDRCLFSRRNGFEGKIILFWSVVLRINGKQII